MYIYNELNNSKLVFPIFQCIKYPNVSRGKCYQSINTGANKYFKHH